MSLGLPAPEFWEITLAEADVIMRAAVARQVRQKSLDDGRAYTLAQLITYAVNDPRRMPKFDKVFPDGRPRKVQSPEAIWAAMEDWVTVMQAAEARTDG